MNGSTTSLEIFEMTNISYLSRLINTIEMTNISHLSRLINTIVEMYRNAKHCPGA